MTRTMIARQPDDHPEAYVALPEEDHECGSSECDLTADLTITFSGAVAPPHYQCIRHWPTTRSILSDTGYFIDYSQDALILIMRTSKPA
jgi:hypothetical protein